MYSDCKPCREGPSPSVKSQTETAHVGVEVCERGRAVQKKFKFEITTNATLLNDEIIGFFRKYGIVPLVSFDGPGAVQDRQRPFRNNKGSYARSLPLIRELLRVIPETVCRATWLPGTNPDRVVEGLLDIGFRKIFLLPVTKWPEVRIVGKSKAKPIDYSPLIMKAEQDAQRLLQCIKDRDAKGIRMIASVSVLLMLMEMILRQIKKESPCGAGRQLVGVSRNGDIFPCHRLTGMAEYNLGSVLEDQFEKQFNPWSHVEDLSACRDCIARHTCRGGCYHDNLESMGNHGIPSEENCQRRKVCFSLADDVVSRLDDIDVEFLDREQIIRKRYCMYDFL